MTYPHPDTPDDIRIEFTNEDMLKVAKIAKARLAVNRSRSKGNRPSEMGDDYKAECIGCAGELAVAKYLKTQWTNEVMTLDEWEQARKGDLRDLGIVEVRATTLRDGGLIIKKTDADDALIVLVRLVTGRPIAYVRGWMVAKSGKHEIYKSRAVSRGMHEVWLVPWQDLHEPSDLKQEIDRRTK